jgi:hypothetical protein
MREEREALLRPLLVRAHQARIPRHIGGEDRGETASNGHWSPGAIKSLANSTLKLPQHDSGSSLGTRLLRRHEAVEVLAVR